jgi:uncharacterized OB-fold protein
MQRGSIVKEILSMSTPIFWRTNQQRYRLQGAICPTCTTVLFPLRACCPVCQQQKVVAKRRVSSPTDLSSNRKEG